MTGSRSPEQSAGSRIERQNDQLRLDLIKIIANPLDMVFEQAADQLAKELNSRKPGDSVRIERASRQLVRVTAAIGCIQQLKRDDTGQTLQAMASLHDLQREALDELMEIFATESEKK